ncbi:beta-1,3-galactosyltransferase brn-like [Mizuhopecten yessoensis]|nr:beta-1,3-galactosyltransferase brn-like [Mizuhopecten yessoensis]
MHIDLKTHVRRKIEEGVDIEVLPINPHPFNYIHSPPECDFEATSDSFNLIILVKSSVQHFALRDGIRKTWGNVTSFSNVQVVFLVAFKQSAQTDIDNEAARFSDIIQENFTDAYKNNTLKTIMGFNWPVDRCSQADVLFFVDDDHIVRITNVIAYLRTFNKIEMKKLYAGFRIDKPSVDRRDGSPWSMSNYDFSHVLWPAYLRGGAFIVSSEIALRFVIAFPYVKLLSVDDSYLGIVADKLGMLPQHDRRFKMDKVNITVCPDYFVYNDYKDPQEIKSVWKTISKE